MATFEHGDQPDYYDTDQLYRYWDLSNDLEVAAGEGFGGADAWEGGGAGAYAVRFPAGANPTRFGFVVRVKIDALPASPMILLGAVDTGDPPELQTCAVLNTDGTVSIYRGSDAGTLLGTSAEVLPSDGSTFRVGFQGEISPTAGSAKVWFAADDDALAEIVQVGGVSTDATGSGVRRGVYIGGAPSVFLSYLYAQGSGTLPDSPLCDVLMTLEDSALMDWDAEPGGSPTNMADAVDETPANDDTDYGYSLAVGRAYAIHHATAPDRPQYLGTRSVALVENVPSELPPTSPPTPAPSYTFTPLVRNAGGALKFGIPTTVSDADWKGVDKVDPSNPFTGLPWTTDEIIAYAWGGKTTV